MSDSLVIPNDLSACQALIGELAQTVEELSQAGQRKDQVISELQLTVNELLQQAFRKRSERYLGHPDQLRLDFGDTDESGDAAEGLAEAIEQAELIVAEHKRRQRSRPKRRNEQLPEHLPRYEVEADVPDEVKRCEQHGERKLIGYDDIETLEFERPKLKVRVTRIPKFACPDEPECGVVEPSRPQGLVEGNRYDTSIAAEIITAKYGYHLPIYRQQDWFGGSGWRPGRSTLLNILQASAELIRPLVQSFRDDVLSDGVVGTDDTRVTLLLPNELPAPIAGDAKSQRVYEVFTQARAENRPSVSARMWAYRGLEVPLNVFDFTVSRHRDGPDEFLVEGQFTGTLLGDCYSGYQGIALRSGSRIVRAACNAHARRKVFESRESDPLLSSQLLAMYQQLYDIEDRARELTVADRQALREREARPVWQRLEELLNSEAAARVFPKDKLAEALRYLRNQWEALTLYLSDGRLPMDNNEVEQLMKQVAIGRKNWLFIGSIAAGERAADLLSLVSSAVRNDLDVWAYVKDVLDRLLSGCTDYASLRPDHWARGHPECIRTHRQDERRYRAEAKRTRRAQRRLNRADSAPR